MTPIYKKKMYVEEVYIDFNLTFNQKLLKNIQTTFPSNSNSKQSKFRRITILVLLPLSKLLSKYYYLVGQNT